jgi:hypothetical protein
VSILLIGLSEELTEELVKRLVNEGDEVRVLEDSDDNAESWRMLGAHIAHGPRWDADLIERAAQNVRTIVVGEHHIHDPTELMDEVVTGGGFASKDMRIVLVGDDLEVPGLRRLRESSLAYVAMGVATKRSLLGRRRVPEPATLAEAIDAADDLAGEPRLELDLGDEQAWSELKLTAPNS